MPDRFALDSPQHAAISGELCLEHGSHHLVSGRTVRRAMLVGGLGAGAWLAMMALGQGHAQAAPAQPLSIGQHAVTTTLGSVAKTASAVTAGVTTSPTHAAPCTRSAPQRDGTGHLCGRDGQDSDPSSGPCRRGDGRSRRSHHCTVDDDRHPRNRPGDGPGDQDGDGGTHHRPQVTAPVTTPIKTVLKPVLAPIVPRVAPIVSPVVGPILTVTAPITATVPTSITRPAFPVHTFSSATLITATATATPAATADVPIGARADVRAARAAPAARSQSTLQRAGRRPPRLLSPSRTWSSDGAACRPARHLFPHRRAPSPARPRAVQPTATTVAPHSSAAPRGWPRRRRFRPPGLDRDRLPGDPIRSTDVSPD